MVNSDLLQFIKAEFSAGATQEEITQLLLGEGGWSSEDVHEAFAALKEGETEVPRPTPLPPAPFQEENPLSLREKLAPLQASLKGVVSPLEPKKEESTFHPVVNRVITPSISVTPPSATGGDILPPLRKPVSTPSPALPDIPASIPQPKSMEAQAFIPDERAKTKEPEVLLPGAIPVEAGAFVSAPRQSSGQALPISTEHIPPLVQEEKKAPAPTPQPMSFPEKEIKSISVAELWSRGTLMPGETTPPPSVSSESKDSPETKEAPVAPQASAAFPPASVAPSVLQKFAPKKYASPEPSLGEKHRSRLPLILGAIFLILALSAGAAVYFFAQPKEAKEDQLFGRMFEEFSKVKSFSYGGTTRLEFTGEVTDAAKAALPVGQSGFMRITVNHEGSAELDGEEEKTKHQFGITAAMGSGQVNINLESKIEVRTIGDMLYIKLTNAPKLGAVDLSILERYWLSMSRSDLARETGLPGLEAGGNYGLFGSASGESGGIRAFIKLYPPIKKVELIGEEVFGGVKTKRYRFALHADNVLQLFTLFSNQFRGNALVIDEEERAAWTSALESVGGDIWIDETSALPRKLVLHHTLDHVISGITVKGSLDTEQEYTAYDVPVEVDLPHPFITFSEFSQVITRQIERDRATGDARREIDASTILAALELYALGHQGAYPNALDILVKEGILGELPKDPDGRAYLYTAYKEKAKFAKSDRCAGETPCLAFHLGITLDDPKRNSLIEDVDKISDGISGSDQKGCAGEAKKACLDYVPVK